MLEIILLIVLAKNIGQKAEAKGRKKFGYQAMLVGMWLGGEVLGAIIGGIVAAAASDGNDVGMLLPYGLALVGAVLGAVTAFVIVGNLPPAASEDEFYRGEDFGDDWRARVKEDRGRPAPLPPSEDITDRADSPRRRPDDRIQEGDRT